MLPFLCCTRVIVLSTASLIQAYHLSEWWYRIYEVQRCTVQETYLELRITIYLVYISILNKTYIFEKSNGHQHKKAQRKLYYSTYDICVTDHLCAQCLTIAELNERAFVQYLIAYSWWCRGFYLLFLSHIYFTASGEAVVLGVVSSPR